MKRGWQLGSLGFLALFVFALWQSTSLTPNDALSPGPGFSPLWRGIPGSILALTLSCPNFADRERRKSCKAMGPTVAELMLERAALLRITAVSALLVVAGPVFEPLGFWLTALAFTALLTPLLGARSPLVLVPFALASS